MVTTTSAAASPDKLSVLGDPVLVSQTATSVTIRWEKVEAAKGYIVKYGKKSVSKAFEAGDMTVTYESETDQVSSTGTTISNLKPDTAYYFAIVGLDAAKNESSATSKELAVTLTSKVAPAAGTGVISPSAALVATGSTAVTVASSGSSLKLSGVTVIDEKTINVDFSASLSKTPVTLKVRKSSDSSSVNVVSIVTDPAVPSRVKVTLASTLSPSSSYSIIVIDAADVKGLPIAEGVNAQKEFATPATLAKAGVKLPVPPTGVTLPSAPTDPATASGETVVAPAVTAAAELPPTGTQENLILLVAAILALGIVYGIQKKRA
jgi:hypothetical protein